LLECSHLTVRYKLQHDHRKVVHAVEDVSLAVRSGEVTAIVGESGCGKSSLLRALALLTAPESGTILLRGEPVAGSARHQMSAYRSEVQLVFQDPFASMNAVKTVGHHLERPLRLHRPARDGSSSDGTGAIPTGTGAAVNDLLERVNLVPGERFAAPYPHELSGGQRQRVMIARALAVRPWALLADEPVSMLDVSVQLDVLNLLVDLSRKERLGLLYVTQNIASARYAADTINVMYAGSIVESGPAQQVTDHPGHPYTQLLLRSMPRPTARPGSPEPAAHPDDTGEPRLFVVPRPHGGPGLVDLAGRKRRWPELRVWSGTGAFTG
jgi:peptide/nickel transport system ATP-binding protein